MVAYEHWIGGKRLMVLYLDYICVHFELILYICIRRPSNILITRQKQLTQVIIHQSCLKSIFGNGWIMERNIKSAIKDVKESANQSALFLPPTSCEIQLSYK